MHRFVTRPWLYCAATLVLMIGIVASASMVSQALDPTAPGQGPSLPESPSTVFLPLVTKGAAASEAELAISPEEGGVLVSPDGRVRLEVPAGAVGSTVTIRYNRRTPQVVAGYLATPIFFELTARDDQNHPVSEFKQDLSFTINYDEVSSLNEHLLALYYSPDGIDWLPVPSQVDVGTNTISATANHFTGFAVLAQSCAPYEVGLFGPEPGHEVEGITDAFRAAYCRNGGESEIGLPYGFVHRYYRESDNGPWIQDFDWASIIYNDNTGTAYYIQGEYISKYVDNGGPRSYLGLPVSDRYAPSEDALLLDKHTNFMENPIQQFEGGFIGNDTEDSHGSGYMIHRYYPVISGGSVEVEWYDPDPDDDQEETKARVSVDAYDIYPRPAYDKVGDAGLADVWIHIDSDQFEGDWLPNEGQGVKVWDGLEPEGEFSLRLEAWVEDAAGYLECDSYQREKRDEDYLIGPIPLGTGYYFDERYYYCSGTGGGGGFRDNTPPVIHEPPSEWQNGHGWAIIDVRVTDNVAVAWVKVILNGAEHFMTLWEGNSRDGTYSVVVPLELGKNTYFIQAADTSGNLAQTGEYEIWSQMSADYGYRPWMGYSDDPVNTGIGNYIYWYQDIQVPALGPDVIIERWFNGQSRYDGPFGIGWTYSYDIRLSEVDNLLFSGVQVQYPDGHTANFDSDGAGGFTSPDATYDSLTKEGGEYVLTMKDQTVYRFDVDGRLLSIADQDDNRITFSYTGEDLAQIVDASGRTITLSYTDGHISTIAVPDYGELHYTYLDGRLASATDTEGNQAQYGYNADGWIVSVTSPKGNPFLAEQEYDDKGRVKFQRGGTGFTNEFTYDDDNNTTTILDPYDNPTTHMYDEDRRLVEVVDALGYSTTYTYNDDNEKLTSTDKNGNTTTYTYDDNGNPLTVTDPLGGVTTYVYDDKNHVTSRTDALGSVFAYEYDDEGHLVRSTDPLSAVTEHVYNDEGLLIRTIDPLGHATDTGYNDLGLPVTVTDALGNVSTMTYDAAGHLLSQTDAEGNTATYQYNSLDLVESVTDPEGYTTFYEYDPDGNLIRETNADGYTKTYTYDENGRLVAESDWAGNGTTFEYDDMGRKIVETDPLGYTTRYEYDPVGNLLSSTDKRGATTTYTYDPNGNVLTKTDALDNVTIYTYDALNRLIETDGPCACGSRIQRTEYDALGRAVQQIDALGNETRFEYDPLGRQVGRVDALGYETGKEYDLDGNLIAETDALGHVTHYEYNALHQLVTTTNRLGYTATNEYDKAGRRIAVTNERGYTTHYVYDGNNRLVQEIDALGGVKAYTYDGRGNQLTATDALGRVTRHEYDANSNRVRTINPRGYVTTYEYDVLNRKARVTDALGGVATYTYEPGGALLAQSDPLGCIQENTYDILGRRIVETDRNGNAATFEYDPAGNLARTTDALGGVTTYTYDANNNKLTETNALGYTTAYEYDALNRQVRVIDALGGVSSRAYDGEGRLIEEIDANSHATQYGYDAEGQRTTTTDALGNVTFYEYDPAGNQVRAVDRNDHATLYEYDALNRRTVLTNALGYTETTSYDAVGNVTERVNFRGYATRYEYDDNNNLIKTVDALDGEATIEYDALDRRTSSTDANGHTTSYGLDAVGNVLSVTLPEGQTSTYTYDCERNRLTFTNAKGYTTAYEYDALNRQVSETDPMGHVSSTEYDPIGQVVHDIDANGNTDGFAYDPLGRLVTVTDALGYITTYTYDPVGNMLTETDANGHVITYEYDPLNRLVSETNPLGNTWLYTYDPEGNLVQVVDANGQTIGYDFDAVNQMVAIHYPVTTQDVAFEYDPNGNLIHMYDAIGETALVYDPLDRQVSKVDPYGRELQNTYDPVGNRLSIAYPYTGTVMYSYNANDWLVEMRDPRGGATTYVYDPDHLRVRTDYPNGTWTDQVYDMAGRLVSQFNGTTYNADVITSYDYTLDAVGNRLRTIEEYTSGQVRTITTTYEYNARYEVLQAVEEYEGPPPYTVLTSYTYDPVGNRLSIVTDRDLKEPETRLYTYDAANHMLFAGDVTYSYDANGNRLTKHTPARPPAQARLETYEYDTENRMTLYTRIFVQSGHIEQRVMNEYDGLGRRLDKGAENSEGVVKQVEYTLDGLSYNQLVEYPQISNPIVTQLYRGANQQLVSMDEIQGDGIGSQYWFATDGLTSIAATTKQNGQSTHEFFYDPYGQIIDENGHWEDSSSWTNPHNHYLLTGKEWDEESRLYYFGARFYDAEAGVWLTQDPYRGELNIPSSHHPYLHLGKDSPKQETINDPMSLHRYLYTRNNPINRIDPLGFFNWNTGHVESGDTLWQISQDSGVSITWIVNNNPQIKHPDKIIVGMYIGLPVSALDAGKRAEAIRRDAGAGESRWGKNPPKSKEEIEFRPCCGPSVTEWFQQEIRNHIAWVQNNVDSDLSEDVLVVLDEFRQYAGNNLASFGSSTFQKGYCPNNFCNGGAMTSVTLCGRCIDVTELGNIVFGATASEIGIRRIWVDLAARRFWDHPEDEASSWAGYRLGNNPDNLCSIVDETIQAPAVRECSACGQSISSGAAHTDPASSVGVAIRE